MLPEGQHARLFSLPRVARLKAPKGPYLCGISQKLPKAALLPEGQHARLFSPAARSAAKAPKGPYL